MVSQYNVKTKKLLIEKHNSALSDYCFWAPYKYSATTTTTTTATNHGVCKDDNRRLEKMQEVHEIRPAPRWLFFTTSPGTWVQCFTSLRRLHTGTDQHQTEEAKYNKGASHHHHHHRHHHHHLLAHKQHTNKFSKNDSPMSRTARLESTYSCPRNKI